MRLFWEAIALVIATCVSGAVDAHEFIAKPRAMTVQAGAELQVAGLSSHVFLTIDPAEHLGIDLASWRTVEDFPACGVHRSGGRCARQARVRRGLRTARRARARLRAVRRLARLAPVRA